jgi:hypothetical protein
MSSLTLRAGPEALAHIRERGLRPADVSVVPGASGGPKWLVLAGIDRYVIGEWLLEPRTRPLHLVGSSIGSWRMACLAQRDSRAALDARTRPTSSSVTRTARHQRSSAKQVRASSTLLGQLGADRDPRQPGQAPARDRGPVPGLTASERRYTQLRGSR